MISFFKYLRNEFLRRIVYNRYTIGKGFYAGIRVRLWAKKSIFIGKNFYIGRDSFIECDVVIGDNVIFGNRVAVIGKYDHNYQQIGSVIRFSSQIRDLDYGWLGLNKITEIEDDVWVGYGSTLLGGVKIGEGSIIAAGSVVARNVDPYSIYAGVPAKKINNRFNNETDLIEHLKMVKSKYLADYQLN